MAPTAIPNGFSYEYQNLIRSVIEIFDQLRASDPTFIGLIPTGVDATNTKEEWLEDELTPVESTIGSFDTDGDGTGINLVSTTGLRIGSILRVTTAADVSRTELVQVVTVDSSTELTTTRDYGGSAGETFVVGDKVLLVSSPLNEKTDPGSGTGQEPEVAFNYTQIFERIAEVSGTAEEVKKYGMASAINYQVANKIHEITRELNSSAIYGRKVIRASGVQGTLGGILSFMDSGNIETTGGAINITILNNMLEAIFNDGASSNNYIILCAENQARKISALNTTGSNPVVSKDRTDRTLGGFVSTFVGDLPAQNGFTAPIVVDRNFAKDQIAIIDMNRIELAWLTNRRLKDIDATLPGFDGVKRRILGEVTIRIKNGTKAHAKATGLNV